MLVAPVGAANAAAEPANSAPLLGISASRGGQCGYPDRAPSDARQGGELAAAVDVTFGTSVLGSWVGVRRLFQHSLFLTAYRMVLPKILVLTSTRGAAGNITGGLSGTSAALGAAQVSISTRILG